MDTQKETLCRILGVDNINALPDVTTRLLQQGVIVSLHVGRWRARRSLDLSDLGIDGEKQSELVNLGQKLLLPLDYLNRLQSVETAARTFVKTRTYETAFGWFVPVDSFQYVKEGLEGYKGQYMRLRDEIVSQYDEIVGNLLEEYHAIARQSYWRKCKLESGNCDNYGEQMYVERFLARIEALIPSKGEIESSFKFDVRLSYIPLPAMLRGDGDSAKLAEVIAAENGLENQGQEFVISTAIQLRQRVYETLENVIETIQTQGKLHPRSIVSLQNLCETVTRLNWSEDTEIKAMVAKIARAMAERGSDDAGGDLESTLKNIVTVARATIIDLGDEPRKSRIVGIADVPAIDTVRQARASLGLVEVKAVSATRGERLL